MTTSTHLKLPFILPAQAGKHITHNEAIAALDTLAQLAVLDRDLAIPPASPAIGARYIVAGSPTGAWSGKTNHIATHDGSVWLFHAPEPGWLAFVLDENGLLAWSGSAWLPTIGLDAKAEKLGLNAAADSTNRLSVKSDAVLFSHDDVTPGSGDLRLKLDKAAAGNTASLLYQTGFQAAPNSALSVTTSSISRSAPMAASGAKRSSSIRPLAMSASAPPLPPSVSMSMARCARNPTRSPPFRLPALAPAS